MPQDNAISAPLSSYLLDSTLADTERRDDDALRHARASGNHLDALTGSRRASKDQIHRSVPDHQNVALGYMNLHRYDEAVRLFRRALELERSTGGRPYNIATALSGLANALRQSGDLETALESIQEARAIADHATFDDDADKDSAMYTICWRQGVILGREDSIGLNRPADAVEPLQKSFDVVEGRSAKDPSDVTSRLRVATAARELGPLLDDSDPRRALAVYDRALMRLREVKGNIRARRQEAQILAQSSYPLRRLGRDHEAGGRIDAALEMLRGAKAYPAAKIVFGDEPETVMRAQADHAAASGQSARALEIYRDLLAKALTSKPDPQNDLSHAHALSRIHLAIARLCLKTGAVGDAERLNAQRLELWRHWDRKLPGNGFIRRQLDAVSAH